MVEESEISYSTIIIWIILLTCVGLLGIKTISYIHNSVSEFNQYKEFCSERPLFCYCSSGECTYRTSERCINEVCIKSNETKELCELATKLNDREMIFKSC